MQKRAVWQLQDAKNKFSELVDRAKKVGPQVVTRHGREAVVVVGFDEYLALTGKKAPTRSFRECLLAAPKVRGGLRVDRDADTGREIDLE